MPDNRARYIATAIQAIVLGVVTYYGVKWLVDALDPTKKSRLAAQKQVMLEACCYVTKGTPNQGHFTAGFWVIIVVNRGNF